MREGQFADMRVVAAEEIDHLILPRSSIASFQSKEEATANAANHCPELPWAKIFDAGLLAFIDAEK